MVPRRYGARLCEGPSVLLAPLSRATLRRPALRGEGCRTGEGRLTGEDDWLPCSGSLYPWRRGRRFGGDGFSGKMKSNRMLIGGVVPMVKGHHYCGVFRAGADGPTRTAATMGKSRSWRENECTVCNLLPRALSKRQRKILSRTPEDPSTDPAIGWPNRSPVSGLTPPVARRRQLSR